GVSGRGEGEWGNGDATARSRGGLLSLALAAAGRALAVECDRWFLWLPVFFAAGIIASFALSNDPQPPRCLVLAQSGFASRSAVRHSGLLLPGRFSLSQAALPRPSF